ncbi:hypothetical protein C2G38_2243101 [Gigaspora rosea]|uniref:Uncharacterized protein n=1 Tax=Gigaspora rosea TaxID=44941 RepID=A0A397VLQ1_9GLOM|nr:hypothetical protein C2G38_2243101 [Gigaspora rosea]
METQLHFDFSDCANILKSEGGKSLADTLCKISILTSLDFSVNKLGLEEGKSLADALCKNSHHEIFVP